ncbi:MAG TPA: nuclear transport factor 2 family protein [Rhodanobacteraceae bacterium]|jgi:hypothetical protein
MKASHAVSLLALLMATPAIAGQVEDQVLAKEKALWVAFQKHDGELFRKSVTADSVQIVTNTAPVVGRDAVVKAMIDPDCTLKSYSLSDEQAHRLAPNVIMLTYVATQDGACGKEAFMPKVHSTAIYVLEKGQWLERYYQETPAK